MARITGNKYVIFASRSGTQIPLPIPREHPRENATLLASAFGGSITARLASGQDSKSDQVKPLDELVGSKDQADVLDQVNRGTR